MKKPFFCLLLLCSALLAFADDEQVEKSCEYFVGEQINGVIVDGRINLQLSEDPSSTGVFFTLPEKYVSKVKVTKTPEDYVEIKFGNDFTKAFKKKITIRIVVGSLKRLELNGDVTAVCKGEFLRTDDVEVLLNGLSASLDYLDVTADNVKLDLGGTTKLQEASVHASYLSLNTSGIGPKVSIVDGSVTKVDLATSGAGRSDINMLNCSVDELNAVVTGLSLVKVNVQQTAKASVQKGATLYYIGKGEITGEGKIKPL